MFKNLKILPNIMANQLEALIELSGLQLFGSTFVRF